MTKYTQAQINAAIDAEAADWAAFFESTDLEGRKAVMRANVHVGYFEPLLPYLSAQIEASNFPTQFSNASHRS